jgi:hypothetical protein
MRLLHYSSDPLRAVRSCEQSGEKYIWHCGAKPVGLWVSVEGKDDWYSWCKSEDFGDIENKIVTEIILEPNNNVLIIDNGASFNKFHDKYGVEGTRPFLRASVNWPAVAADYQGVIIAPYRWEHRFDSTASGWYYSWDCASGCIWDAAAVSGLVQISQRHAA